MNYKLGIFSGIYETQICSTNLHPEVWKVSSIKAIMAKPYLSKAEALRDTNEWKSSNTKILSPASIIVLDMYG